MHSLAVVSDGLPGCLIRVESVRYVELRLRLTRDLVRQGRGQPILVLSPARGPARLVHGPGSSIPDGWTDGLAYRMSGDTEEDLINEIEPMISSVYIYIWSTCCIDSSSQHKAQTMQPVAYSCIIILCLLFASLNFAPAMNLHVVVFTSSYWLPTDTKSCHNRHLAAVCSLYLRLQRASLKSISRYCHSANKVLNVFLTVCARRLRARSMNPVSQSVNNAQ